MAQAKRKRRSKHRGTQAGTVDRPGRTHRGAASDAPRTRESAKAEARRRREERLSRPPTWRGAFNRAAIAAALLAVLAVLVLDQPVPQAVILAAFMLLVYIPLGYYFDRFLYRLRRRRGGRAAAGRGR